MIKEVDEDDDGAICFREFLLIFKKAAAGELDLESGLGKLASLTEVDVDEVGVGGAKTFFEAKVCPTHISLTGVFTHILLHINSFRLKKPTKVASSRRK